MITRGKRAVEAERSAREWNEPVERYVKRPRTEPVVTPRVEPVVTMDQVCSFSVDQQDLAWHPTLPQAPCCDITCRCQ